MNLDYSVESDEDRLAIVRELCAKPSKFSQRDIERMADYLLRTRERGTTVREHRREYPLVTHNRSVTHAARNVSLDGMGESVEFFVDGSVVATGTPTPVSDPITDQDVIDVPGLAENRVVEASLREAVENASGHRRRQLKSQLIEVWREAYFLRSMHRGVDTNKVAARVVRDVAHLRLDGEVYLGDDGYPVDTSPISAMEPSHVSYVLQWYAQLKKEVADDLNSDMHWFLVDFADLVRRTLPPGTPLHDLAALRAIGYQLKDIPPVMERLHGISKNANQWNYVLTHTVSNAIARRAQKEWLVWYYSNVAYGEWKQCGRCGKWKLAHPMFFARNGNKLYSICKECRKVKAHEPGDVHLSRRGVIDDA